MSLTVDHVVACPHAWYGLSGSVSSCPLTQWFSLHCTVATHFYYYTIYIDRWCPCSTTFHCSAGMAFYKSTCWISCSTDIVPHMSLTIEASSFILYLFFTTLFTLPCCILLSTTGNTLNILLHTSSMTEYPIVSLQLISISLTFITFMFKLMS